MFYKIYCLMVSGVAIDDAVRNTLFHVARRMLLKGQEKIRVKTDSVEGIVTTDMKIGCIGALAGIVFFAEVDTNLGSTKASYILDPTSVEREEWDEVFWADAIFPEMKESSAKHPALNAQNN